MRIRLPAYTHRWVCHACQGLVVLLLTATAGCRIDLDRAASPDHWPHGSRRAGSWQWQLTGDLDLTAEADVFVLDPVTATSTETAALRSRHRQLVCHVPVGSYRPTDPDVGRLPPAVRGEPGAPRAGRWVDVRQWSLLEPVLADRMRLCRGKGFEAVALADVDGYAHRSGFPLTFDDQIRFNRQVAALARSLDLSPGLVDDLDQVTALAPDFDFGINTDCVRLGRCASLLAFVDTGKPVLHVEFTGSPTDFCVTSLGYGFVSIRKHQELDAWREPCPDWSGS